MPVRTIGTRTVVELPSAIPVPGAFARAAAQQAAVFGFERRVAIPHGCYRLSHAEANRQMDDAVVALMVGNARKRAHD